MVQLTRAEVSKYSGCSKLSQYSEALGRPGACLFSLFPRTRILLLILFYLGCTVQPVGSVSRRGIEPVPPALEAQRLNHWAAREVPGTQV